VLRRRFQIGAGASEMTCCTPFRPRSRGEVHEQTMTPWDEIPRRDRPMIPDPGFINLDHMAHRLQSIVFTHGLDPSSAGVDPRIGSRLPSFIPAAAPCVPSFCQKLACRFLLAAPFAASCLRQAKLNYLFLNDVPRITFTDVLMKSVCISFQFSLRN
jgi:hypothetical protein